MSPPVYFEYWVSNDLCFSRGDKNSSKYFEEFQRCKNAILAVFPNIKIIPNAEFNRIRAEAMNVLYPREGAFEVYLGKTLIFSKLRKNEWPDTKKLVKKMKTILKRRRTQKDKSAGPRQKAHLKIYGDQGKKKSLIPRLQINSPSKSLKPITTKTPTISIQRQDTINLTTISQSRINTSIRDNMVTPNSFLLDNWLTDASPYKNDSYDGNLECDIVDEEELKFRHITRTFEIFIDRSKYTNKKLTYKNKTENDCTYSLRSSSKNMRMIARTVTIEAGMRKPFKIVFLPVHTPARCVYYFLVDLEGIPLETIKIITNYE